MRCSILLLFSMLLLGKSSDGMQQPNGIPQHLSLEEKVSMLGEIVSLQCDLLKVLVPSREEYINKVNKLEKEVTNLKQSMDEKAQAKEARHKKNKRRRARTR